MPIEQHAVLCVPPNGTCQHSALHVCAHGSEAFGGVRVVYALHLLLDDGPLIQVRRHVAVAPMSLTPRSWAWKYGRAPLKLGKNEW